MQYIDMHCDTLTEALVRKQKTMEELSGTMVDIRRLKTAGAEAQFFAMFLPQRERRGQTEAGMSKQERKAEEISAREWEKTEETLRLERQMQSLYGIYRSTLESCKDILAEARSSEELEQNRKAGKISAFLTMENGFLIQGKLENVKRFYDMGVRLITLTWNHPNGLGQCHTKEPEKMKQGLTEFGWEAVSYMQELGILVDVSHLSDGGFYDVAALSKQTGIPFVASHSNCRALSPSTRNLTDGMIRRLAEYGGVAGINLEPSFLNWNTEDSVSRIERVCDHICHLIDRGGTECVSIGTDFDGISGQLEIDACTKLPRLFAALRRRGISEDTVEKITHKNVKRVIREGMR